MVTFVIIHIRDREEMSKELFFRIPVKQANICYRVDTESADMDLITV